MISSAQNIQADLEKIGDYKVFGKFINHAGDAYGLNSDASVSEKKDFGFVLITNGCFGIFEKGNTTSLSKLEVAIISLLITDYLKTNIKN